MTTRMTITEALAEIKTTNSRIAKQREFITARLARPAQLKDPLESEGGMAQAIKQKRQSCRDLRERLVKLRSAIHSANSQTPVTIGGVTRTVADWIVWRREVSADLSTELTTYAKGIDNIRQTAQRQGIKTRSPEEAAELTDMILHLSETELATEREQLEKVLGDLDGQLSLKNATTLIEVND